MINNLRSIGALGAVYVACAAVGTAQAAGPDDRAEARGPGAIGTGAAVTGNTPPWLRALDERSEALNREYGLGDHAERRQLGAPGPNWLVALNERSEALNRKYGLGDYGPTRGASGRATSSGTTVIQADDRSGLRGSHRVALTVFSVPSAEPAEDGFTWDDAALSVGATLAVAAVLGAGAVSIRYRRGVTLR
jgi:hypothetical protein